MKQYFSILFLIFSFFTFIIDTHVFAKLVHGQIKYSKFGRPAFANFDDAMEHFKGRKDLTPEEKEYFKKLDVVPLSKGGSPYKVKTYELPSDEDSNPNFSVLLDSRENNYSSVDEIILDQAEDDFLSKIKLIGERAMALYKKGIPVINVYSNPYSVLPKNADGNVCSLNQLNSWVNYEKKYRQEYENIYGMTVFRVDFIVKFKYWGIWPSKPNNLYLADATVEPVNLSVAWGFDADISVSDTKPYNAAYRGEGKAIAGIKLLFSYRVYNWLNERLETGAVYMNGRGDTQLIGDLGY